MSIIHNGEEVESGLGFCVAQEMARMLSLRGGIYEVADNGRVLIAYKDGNRIED